MNIIKKILVIMLVSLGLAYFSSVSNADDSVPAIAPSSSSSSADANIRQPNQDNDPHTSHDANSWGSRDHWRFDHGDHNFHPGIFPAIVLTFILLLALGRHYSGEKTEQRRLALLSTLVEKGHPLPEGMIAQVLNSDRKSRRGRHPRPPAMLLGRGIACVIISIGFLTTYFTHLSDHTPFLVVGIILLGVGIGSLVSLKAQEKYLKSQPADKAE